MNSYINKELCNNNDRTNDILTSELNRNVTTDNQQHRHQHKEETDFYLPQESRRLLTLYPPTTAETWNVWLSKCTAWVVSNTTKPYALVT